MARSWMTPSRRLGERLSADGVRDVDEDRRREDGGARGDRSGAVRTARGDREQGGGEAQRRGEASDERMGSWASPAWR